MRTDRTRELLAFAANIRLIIKDNNDKFVAFTTDYDGYNVGEFLGDLASILADNARVMVMSYEEIERKSEGVMYHVVDANTDKAEDVVEACADADIVLVDCPNVLTSKSYLHMSAFVKNAVIVAKKWHSKTNNVKNIATILTNRDMTVLGAIYEK